MIHRQMTRREFLRLAALGTSAAALSACAPAAPAAAPTAKPAAATSAPAGSAPPATRPRLTFMSPGSQAEDTAFAAVFEGFKKLYPDIDAVYAPAGTGYPPQGSTSIPAYNEKLLTMFASGTAPDVFKTLNGYFGSWSSKNLYVQLDDYAKANPDLTQLDDFFPGHVAGCRYQGKLFALPNDGAPQGQWVNVDMFTKTGLGVQNWDWTWDKLVEAAKAMTKKDGSVTTIHGMGCPDWEPVVWANGGELLDPEGKTCIFNTPEVIEGLAWMQDLVVKLQVSPTLPSLKEMSVQERFINGKLGTFFGVRGGMGQLRNIKNFKFDAAPMIMSNKKKRVTKLSTGLTSIWKGSKNPDAAYKLLTFICSTEGQRLKISSGFGHPSRKSSVQQDWYKGFTCAQCSSTGVNSVWPDMLVRGEARNVMAHPKEAEITQTVLSEMDALLDGSKTPTQVAQDITKAVNKILAS